ncbi:MAG: protein kinase [Nitrososphaerales archaeon]
MIGKTISHFKILEKLGEGGMGVVYKAEDTNLDRHVALKFLPSHLSDSEEEKQRFIHEAKAASALNHQNIMTIYEIDEVEDPATEGRQTFIAMEYVEGETLKDKLEKGPLKTKELLKVTTAAAEGLNTAHQKEIIHRDIKSENIMVSTEGLVKIMDFGLAKRKGVTRVTKEGSTLGTLAYMSPEQTEGLKVDRRSDLFSFGVVMYEMATGQLPFKGEHDAAILYAIVNEAPLPVTTLNPNIPKKLEEFIHKALRKEVEERYQHADDLLADLNNLKKEIETAKTAVTKAHMPITREPKRKPFYIYAGLAVLVTLVILIGVYLFPEKREAIDSIAVLPLGNLMDDPTEDYFVEGMHEAIIRNLSRLSALKVISRTSAMRYKDTDKLMREIARELNVDALVEGSVMKAGNRVRITAQLIHGVSDEHLWSNEWEEDLTDVLSLQKTVAEAITKEIGLALAPEEEADLTNAPNVNPEAYNLYLKGWHFRTLESSESIPKAIKYLEQAVELDSTFALAWSALGHSYLIMQLLGDWDPDYALDQVKPALDKALELDANLPDAHAGLGIYRHIWKLDIAAAEASFRRALELDPDNVYALFEYGMFLVRTGRPDEGQAEFRRALELDPLSPQLLFGNGLFHTYTRRYDKALEYYQAALELAPDYGRPLFEMSWAKCEILMQQGRYVEAAAEAEKVGDMFQQLRVDWAQGNRTKVYAAHDSMRVLYDEQEHPFVWASAYAIIGEKKKALSLLERRYEENITWGNTIALVYSPGFDSLRAEPRFKALLKRLGLSEVLDENGQRIR